MSYYQTRTVRSVVSDGRGPPKVESKSFTISGPGGSNIGFAPSEGFGDIRNIGNAGGQFQIDLGNNFGGKQHTFNIGGGGGGPGGAPAQGHGGGGQRFQHSSAPKPKPAPGAAPAVSKPKVSGRPSRANKKDPFAAYKTQKTDNIKAECQQRGVLFEDPEFPCVDSSLFYSRPPNRKFEWRRPHEIVDNPQWVSDGASRFDVKQGELGDCWLLAAVASLTCNNTLFEKVVDTRQNFSDNYCGVFRFNFWHEGEWKEVVVDDRLPTYYDQLVFMHSADKKEFWSALLEKAYAKLMGSYEALKGGSTSEAMCDFTGGVTEMFDLPKAPPNLLRIMLKAHDRGSLMGCSIDADPRQTEARLENGLVMGHAYSITNVCLADIKTPKFEGQIPMVRVRNPWGNDAEWKGAWSDGSREWGLLSQSEKDELGLNFSDDGEFWMSFQDWSTNFQKLEICNLGPDSLEEEDLSNKKKWECYKESSEWVKGHSAGGCRNFLESFATNPQFRMTLTDPDDDDDDDMCTALIAVMQKDRRKKRKEGLDLLTVGYVIYKVEDENSGPLTVKYFKYHASVAKSPTFINMREICGRHKLPPGTYAIIPSTFEPNFEGKFLIRIFSEKPNVAGELDEQTTLIEDDKRGPGEDNMSASQVAPAYAAPPSSQEDPQAYQQNYPYRSDEAPPAEPTEAERAQADALRETFRRVAGVDMEIDAYELREILNAVFQRHFKFDGFGIDTCRSMVAMHDGDLSGKLGYEEFKELWEDLRKWKGVFLKYDRDRSGNLSSYELRDAMTEVGFKVSNACRMSLVKRYANRENQMEFGDFILCVIRLKTMLKTYKSFDPECRGYATFSPDEFIQSTMYS